MTTPPDLPSYPVWPTVLIMTLLALASSFVWWAGTFAGNATVVAASGPFAWFLHGPALIAGYGAAATIGVVVLPALAVGGGRFFAMRASGDKGSAASDMQVTFFSESHPIAKATQILAAKMGLPPIAYIGWFPNEDINAFAMGDNRKNALVALSKGAVERLSKQELLAVIAHELGHVASNDMAKMAYAKGVQEALTFFLVLRDLKQVARWIFTPFSEMELLRMSRAREFTADRIAAMMLGPGPMIAALEKLRDDGLAPRPTAYANVMLASRLSQFSWLSTHPPLEKRIAALQNAATALEKREMRLQGASTGPVQSTAVVSSPV